jgi:hypothetical protein
MEVQFWKETCSFLINFLERLIGTAASGQWIVHAWHTCSQFIVEKLLQLQHDRIYCYAHDPLVNSKHKLSYLDPCCQSFRET